MTTQAQQDWFDACQARFAQPDTTPREERNGQIFVRTLGKRCPWCGNVFFAYQVEGEEKQPYQIDPNPMLNKFGEPANGIGTRETCGHPKCWDAEDTYQADRRQVMRAEYAKARAAAKVNAPIAASRTL